MKSREIACIHYEYEGGCAIGKEGTFRKTCQKCQSYKPIKGGRPARPNLRNKKREEIRKKDFKKAINNY